MVQVNSSNYGYNLPTKYTGADDYSLESDGSRALPPRAGARCCRRLVDRMSAACSAVRELSVTDGANGVMVAGRRRAFTLPTLSTGVVGADRVRRRLLRVQQSGRVCESAAADGGAGRQHRRRRHGAAPLQRAPGFRIRSS